MSGVCGRELGPQLASVRNNLYTVRISRYFTVLSSQVHHMTGVGVGVGGASLLATVASKTFCFPIYLF